MKKSAAAITPKVMSAATNLGLLREVFFGGGNDDAVPSCPVWLNDGPDFRICRCESVKKRSSLIGPLEGGSEASSLRMSFNVTACGAFGGGRSFSRMNRPVGRSVVEGTSMTPSALESAVTASPAVA